MGTALDHGLSCHVMSVLDRVGARVCTGMRAKGEGSKDCIFGWMHACMRALGLLGLLAPGTEGQ